jgi:Na+-dependent transporters of the SNF family
MRSSEEQTRPERSSYQLPARLSTEDKLIILGPLSLTLRQSFVLTLAGCLAVDIWRGSTILATWGGLGLVIRLLAAGIVGGIGLIWAFLAIADRYLEDWAIILLRYLNQPKQYRWQSLSQSMQDQRPPSRSRRWHRGQKAQQSISPAQEESESW